jgi:ribosomal protein S18 acetylase RimI-like enzyme
MWPDKPLDFVILPNDIKGLHYGLFADGQLVSVISMFVDGGHAQFRKFATDNAYQGKGFGTQLLTFLIEEAKNSGIKTLSCDARVTAINFYEKFGMKVASEVFQKSGREYVKLRLQVFE